MHISKTHGQIVTIDSNIKWPFLSSVACVFLPAMIFPFLCSICLSYMWALPSISTQWGYIIQS